MIKRPLRVLIYGSCVSRDTFEGLDPTRFALVEYVARQSLISAFGPHTHPLPTLGDTSRFRARMITGDLAGNLPLIVIERSSDTDALLWDLADERLGVYVLPDGSVVTRSADTIGTALDDACAQQGRLVQFGTAEHLSMFKGALGSWTELLKRRGLLDRTLVLAPDWAAHASDGTPVPTSFGISAEVANSRYRPYYEAVAKAGFETVRLTDVTASTEHRWGAAPFHFADSVYTVLHGAIEAWAGRREHGCRP